MARSVQDPVLRHRTSAAVGPDGAGVADPAGGGAAPGRGAGLGGGFGLGHYLVAIDRVHGRIAVAMEHDGRNEKAEPVRRRRPPLAHCRKGRGDVARLPRADAAVRSRIRGGLGPGRRPGTGAAVVKRLRAGIRTAVVTGSVSR